jgi:hypothetical protein
MYLRSPFTFRRNPSRTVSTWHGGGEAGLEHDFRAARQLPAEIYPPAAGNGRARTEHIFAYIVEKDRGRLLVHSPDVALQ